nr:IQ domain-containing protein IQM1-like [Ipomoea batatas]
MDDSVVFATWLDDVITAGPMVKFLRCVANCWCIWRGRNDLVCGGKSWQPLRIRNEVSHLLESWKCMMSTAVVANAQSMQSRCAIDDDKPSLIGSGSKKETAESESKKMGKETCNPSEKASIHGTSKPKKFFCSIKSDPLKFTSFADCELCRAAVQDRILITLLFCSFILSSSA